MCSTFSHYASEVHLTWFDFVGAEWSGKEARHLASYTLNLNQFISEIELKSVNQLKFTKFSYCDWFKFIVFIEF